MASRKTKLTKRLVESLPAAPAVLWDTELPGFALRVSETGTKTYFVQRRDASGRQVKVKIGRHDILGTERARTAAQQVLAQLTLGTLPERERKAKAESKDGDAPQTLGELWQRFAEKRLALRRPSSARTYRSLWRCHLAPMASKRLADITPALVNDLHGEITIDVGPFAANHACVLLKVLLAMAELRGWVAHNAARGFAKNAERGRERYLTTKELERVLGILHRDGGVIDRAMEFLILTGCRRGEVISMAWADVDLSEGVWVKPRRSVKSDRVHRLPLSPEAIELLGSVPRVAPLVFNLDPHGNALHRRWAVVRREAKVADVRLHDLRHLHAKMLVDAGTPLAVIRDLLGHSSVQMTERYAHVDDRQTRAATAHVGKALSNVVAFRK